MPSTGPAAGSTPRRSFRVPTALAVAVLAGVGSGACTPRAPAEDLGDGCAQFRNAADVVTQVYCRVDAGCVRYASPDGAFRQMVCLDPSDFECRFVTEADGAVERIC